MLASLNSVGWEAGGGGYSFKNMFHAGRNCVGETTKQFGLCHIQITALHFN